MIAGASLFVLTGCSVDAVLWGPDGARVIETTDELVAAASTGEQSHLACADFAGDFGEPTTWVGLSAGEPEQFDGATSVDRPGLDATWRINLEGGMASGKSTPTDVFYSQDGESLCIADVIWQTIQG